MTISVRKNRKAHYNPSQYNRRIRMSSNLSAPLRQQLGIKSFPISRNDEVIVISGNFKGKTGTILSVNRRRYKVTIDTCTKVVNGKMEHSFIDASNLQITKMDTNRKCVVKKVEHKRMMKEMMMAYANMNQ